MKSCEVGSDGRLTRWLFPLKVADVFGSLAIAPGDPSVGLEGQVELHPLIGTREPLELGRQPAGRMTGDRQVDVPRHPTERLDERRDVVVERARAEHGLGTSSGR